MKKIGPIGIVILVVVVVFLLLRGGEEPAPVDLGNELVTRILAPEPVPRKPAKLSTMTYEMIEVYEEIEVEEAEAAVPDAEPTPKKVSAAARVSPDQVLAVVNGRPVTGAKLMPPSRFKKTGTAVLPMEILKEALERSIETELIFQEADVQGMVLGERGEAQLNKMFLHLTGNPLSLPEGQEVVERNVWGGDEDAAFHVREQASRLLQVGFLEQSGQSDTAEARLAFREQLKNGATIETVELELPAAAE